jgi:hypothetical protein
VVCSNSTRRTHAEPLLAALVLTPHAEDTGAARRGAHGGKRRRRLVEAGTTWAGALRAANLAEAIHALEVIGVELLGADALRRLDADRRRGVGPARARNARWCRDRRALRARALVAAPVAVVFGAGRALVRIRRRAKVLALAVSVLPPRGIGRVGVGVRVVARHFGWVDGEGRVDQGGEGFVRWCVGVFWRGFVVRGSVGGAGWRVVSSWEGPRGMV